MAGKNRLAKVFLEKPYLITFALAGVLVVAAGAVLVGLNLAKQENTPIAIIEAGPENKTIYVDVGGAVTNPGIYEFKTEARVNDALVAAGGLSKGADSDWVSHNLNLAEKLTDANKVYIPFRGEEKDREEAESGLININKASLTDLDQLWGVGPVSAQKIIDNRPYSKTSDLLDKKVIKSNIFEAIKDKITVL